jgi:SAM-dependent MidA family methyltransferase
LNHLVEIISTEIKKGGAISFEEFMRLALYCPVYGFYEKEKDRIGRNGDFYTSVSVGKLFGELLAFQFADWLLECKSETRPVQIVEAGAHRGDLARDILTWFRAHRPELFQRLEYIVLEPSAARQKWQSATLADFGDKVNWLSHITHHATRFHGIVFANELLDAMPVCRFGWDARRKSWFEWGVTLESGSLVWTNLECSRRRDEADGAPVCQIPPRHVGGYLDSAIGPFATNEKLLAVLPDRFTFETSPDAEIWWQNAAQALECGKLMTIDYGMTTDELISPERKNGTLRGYYRHHPTSDLLANPGDQDLTAHVNFSALIAAGEANGLNTETFQTQAQFLTKILLRAQKSDASEQWNAARVRQFQTLTHPEHLGHSFRVLVQTRGARPQ